MVLRKQLLYSAMTLLLALSFSLAAGGCAEVDVAVEDDTGFVTASASPTRGVAPLSVTFSAATASNNAPFSYEWDFGDGMATSDLPGPTHVYTKSGSYTATVTVTDRNGKTDSDQVQIEVEAESGSSALDVDLAASPSSGIAPLTVSLTTQIQGGDAPYTYAWEFGDGETSSSATPSHIFNAVGRYEVKLTLTDATGQVAQDSVTVEVQAPNTLAVNPSASPDRGIAPLTVQFQSAASGGSNPLSYAWEFGDGNTSEEKNPRHIYTDPGGYNASLTVTDALGTTASGSVTIEVGSNAAPSASASASPHSGVAPLTTEFFGSATGGDAPLSYKWTFGDGSPSVNTKNTTHQYANPGSYTATLLVTDADGDTDTATVSIDVRDRLNPSVSANATPTSGHAPLDVNFNALAARGAEPYTYKWNFGDASPTSTAQNPSHQYSDAGSYIATVMVTDSEGNTASNTVNISVSNNSVPAVSATVDDATGIAPHAVQLTANASGGDAPLSYEWIFDDSTPNATGRSVSHTYDEVGFYEAKVIVTDADGDTASATVDVLVLEGSPDLAVESFSVTPAGQSLTYTIDIKNRGQTDSTAPFLVAFYHDRNSPPASIGGEDGIGLLEDGDAMIAAGETIQATITFGNLPPGDHSAYVWVDPNNELADLDRSNNIAGPVHYTIETAPNTSNTLLINEFMYDSPGADINTFIELYGPPNMDISGYKLVHTSGNTGNVVKSYTFPAGTKLRANGFFVLGDTADVVNVDIIDGFSDLQNKANNLLLRDANDQEIDAVGYGDFGANDVFEGRGAPAHRARDGYSLGRADAPNTDDNFTDFVNWRIPTPGAPNKLALSNNADTCDDAYLFADEVNTGGVFSISGDLADATSNQFTSLSQSGAGVCEATGTTFGGLDQIYKFTVPSQGAMALISFEDHSNKDLDLILTKSPCTSLNSGFEACIEGEEANGVSEDILALDGGDYYLVVLEDATSPSGASSLPYSIRVEIEY